MKMVFSLFVTLLLLSAFMPLNAALAAPNTVYKVFVQTLDQAGNCISSGQLESITSDANNQIRVNAPDVPGYSVVVGATAGYKTFDVSTADPAKTIEVVFYYQSASSAPGTGTIVLKDVTSLWTKEAYDENGQHLGPFVGSDYVLRPPVVISGLELNKTYDLNLLRHQYLPQPLTDLYPAAQPVGNKATSVTLDALHSYVVVNDQYDVPRQLTRDLQPSTPPRQPTINGANSFRALVTTYGPDGVTLIGCDPFGSATTAYYAIESTRATKVYLDPYIFDFTNGNHMGTNKMYSLAPRAGQTDATITGASTVAQFTNASASDAAYINVFPTVVDRSFKVLYNQMADSYVETTYDGAEANNNNTFVADGTYTPLPKYVPGYRVAGLDYTDANTDASLATRIFSDSTATPITDTITANYAAGTTFQLSYTMTPLNSVTLPESMPFSYYVTFVNSVDGTAPIGPGGPIGPQPQSGNPGDVIDVASILPAGYILTDPAALYRVPTQAMDDNVVTIYVTPSPVTNNTVDTVDVDITYTSDGFNVYLRDVAGNPYVTHLTGVPVGSVILPQIPAGYQAAKPDVTLYAPVGGGEVQVPCLSATPTNVTYVQVAYENAADNTLSQQEFFNVPQGTVLDNLLQLPDNTVRAAINGAIDPVQVPVGSNRQAVFLDVLVEPFVPNLNPITITFMDANNPAGAPITVVNNVQGPFAANQNITSTVQEQLNNYNSQNSTDWIISTVRHPGGVVYITPASVTGNTANVLVYVDKGVSLTVNYIYTDQDNVSHPVYGPVVLHGLDPSRTYTYGDWDLAGLLAAYLAANPGLGNYVLVDPLTTTFSGGAGTLNVAVTPDLGTADVTVNLMYQGNIVGTVVLYGLPIGSTVDYATVAGAPGFPAGYELSPATGSFQVLGDGLPVELQVVPKMVQLQVIYQDSTNNDAVVGNPVDKSLAVGTYKDSDFAADVPAGYKLKTPDNPVTVDAATTQIVVKVVPISTQQVNVWIYYATDPTNPASVVGSVYKQGSDGLYVGSIYTDSDFSADLPNGYILVTPDNKTTVTADTTAITVAVQKVVNLPVDYIDKANGNVIRTENQTLIVNKTYKDSYFVSGVPIGYGLCTPDHETTVDDNTTRIEVLVQRIVTVHVNYINKDNNQVLKTVDMNLAVGTTYKDSDFASGVPGGYTLSAPNHENTVYAYTTEVNINVIPSGGGGGGGGGGGTSSYNLVYKAGNGVDKDVTESVNSGTSLTVKDGGSIFTVPDGKEFAGWATTSGGDVVYKPGDTIKMTKNLTLYAVWKEKEPLVILNKSDHMAYINGYPDGTVRPGNNITREEVAAIFYRLLTADAKTQYQSSGSSFSDVSPDRWSATAIATLKKAGILDGYQNGTFRPKAAITRAEFATMAARFDNSAVTNSAQFTDISGHWAQSFIDRAATLGWIKGFADGTFRPNQDITRAEAVTLINRMLGRDVQSASDLLPAMKTWKDNANPSAWYYLDMQEATNSHDYTRNADGATEKWVSLLAS